MIEKLLAFIAGLTLLVVISAISFNEFYQNEVKVLVKIKENEDPFLVMKQLMPLDSRIIDIKEINKSGGCYEIVVVTKRNKINILNWIKNSTKIQEVEIKNEL